MMLDKHIKHDTNFNTLTLSLHLFLIAIIGLIVYANTFQVPFVFDDAGNIVDNYLIKDLRSFTEPSQLLGTRYVGNLTFALNFYLHGLNVAGYHVVNLAVHICNAILIYVLVTLLFETPKNSVRMPGAEAPLPYRLLALMISLLFVTHPIQTQAVTYIVQRFTTLATMWYLCSLVLYIKARIACTGTWQLFSAKTVCFIFSVIAALLAMKTKEIAFTLPIVIVVFECMFFAGDLKKRMRSMIPLLLTMLVIPLSLLFKSRPAGELINAMDVMTRAQTDMSRSYYLMTQFRVIVTYLRLLLVPVNQNLDHHYQVSRSLFTSEVLFSLLLLVLLIALGGYLFYRSRSAAVELRIISFGIFWFFITLLVESSIIPITDLMFEHRVYLPSTGFFIAAVTGAAILLRRYLPGFAQSKVIAVVCSIIILGTVLTAIARNEVWKDEATLWRDAVSKSPDKLRPHINLGTILTDKGEFDAAIKELQRALSINFYSTEAHYALGIAYHDKGELDAAIQEFMETLKIMPDYKDTHNILGVALARSGKIDAAIREFHEELRKNPKNMDADKNMKHALALKGRNSESGK